jgi:hypothetical protein
MLPEIQVPQLLRHADLVARGITTSWARTRHLQTHEGFPLGKLLGPNSRVWSVDEILAWWNSRPSGVSDHVAARAEKSVAARAAKAVSA